MNGHTVAVVGADMVAKMQQRINLGHLPSAVVDDSWTGGLVITLGEGWKKQRDGQKPAIVFSSAGGLELHCHATEPYDNCPIILDRLSEPEQL